jgi:hypothetical protein
LKQFLVYQNTIFVTVIHSLKYVILHSIFVNAKMNIVNVYQNFINVYVNLLSDKLKNVNRKYMFVFVKQMKKNIVEKNTMIVTVIT